MGSIDRFFHKLVIDSFSVLEFFKWHKRSCMRIFSELGQKEQTDGELTTLRFSVRDRCNRTGQRFPSTLHPRSK